LGEAAHDCPEHSTSREQRAASGRAHRHSRRVRRAEVAATGPTGRPRAGSHLRRPAWCCVGMLAGPALLCTQRAKRQETCTQSRGSARAERHVNGPQAGRAAARRPPLARRVHHPRRHRRLRRPPGRVRGRVPPHSSAGESSERDRRARARCAAERGAAERRAFRPAHGAAPGPIPPPGRAPPPRPAPHLILPVGSIVLLCGVWEAEKAATQPAGAFYSVNSVVDALHSYLGRRALWLARSGKLGATQLASSRLGQAD